jgi:hypothetical protein
MLYFTGGTLLLLYLRGSGLLPRTRDQHKVIPILVARGREEVHRGMKVGAGTTTLQHSIVVDTEGSPERSVAHRPDIAKAAQTR